MTEGSTTEAPTALIRMVNQIAANYVHLPTDEAAAQVANHLRMFWAPPMRAELVAWADAGGEGLEPVALATVARLRAKH